MLSRWIYRIVWALAKCATTAAHIYVMGTYRLGSDAFIWLGRARVNVLLSAVRVQRLHKQRSPPNNNEQYWLCQKKKSATATTTTNICEPNTNSKRLTAKTLRNTSNGAGASKQYIRSLVLFFLSVLVVYSVYARIGYVQGEKCIRLRHTYVITNSRHVMNVR